MSWVRPESNPRGEAHPRAKLKGGLADEARRRVAAGESRASVARSLGVSRSCVERAVLGLTYGRVPPTLEGAS